MPRVAVPRRVALREPETGIGGEPVVLRDRQLLGTGLEPRDEEAARAQVARHIRDDGGLAPRRQEDHHVTGRDDDIERAPEGRGREVRPDPRELGRSAPGRGEHVLVEVDADDADSTSGQLPRDAAGAAPGIEDRTRREAHDEVRLAVDVLARGGEPVVACVVRVTGHVLGPKPPILRSRHVPDTTRR